MTCEELQFMLS